MGLFVLVGAKVISVSYGSPTSATALMASSGPIAIVMGTLVFQLGSIGIWVMLMLGLVGERRGLSSTDRVIVRGLAVTLWVVLSLLWWWAWLFLGAVTIDRVFGSPVMRWLIKRGWLPSQASKEDSLLGRVDQINESLESFAKRAQAGQESVLARLDDLRERLRPLPDQEQAGEDVVAEAKALESEVDALKSELDALESEVRSESDALESRSGELDRQIARYSTFEAIFFTAIGALTLILYLLPTPWIAPQRIELANGMQFVGYVVSDEGTTDTVVLTDVDRRVLMIPSDDVARSELCTHQGTHTPWLGSILDFFYPDPKYPPCDRPLPGPTSS